VPTALRESKKSEEDIVRRRLELVPDATGFDLWENDLDTGAAMRPVNKVLADAARFRAKHAGPNRVVCA
jgi:hypothetical protein